MPYSDPVKMAEYMRQYRLNKKKLDQVNVNPSVNRKPVNPNFRNSQIAGSYENSLWTGICPVCNFHNTMDPKRSFRPVEKCNHFQQLVIPGTASEFLFLKGNKQSVNRKPLERKPVNPSVNPVNLPKDIPKEKYLLSYSRNKYQYVLYSIDSRGNRNLVRSCKKNDKINLGPCEIELTWGPEEAEVENAKF
jgi:hypothetical protein